jgi:hypothetical protein
MFKNMSLHRVPNRKTGYKLQWFLGEPEPVNPDPRVVWTILVYL